MTHCVPLTEQGAYQFDLTADSINVDRYMAPADAGSADASAGAQDDIEIPVDLIRALNANGSMKLERAYLSGMTFENMVLGVNSANGQLRMHPISADLFDGTYNGDVRINAASDTPSISVNEKIAGVQLDLVEIDISGMRADLVQEVPIVRYDDDGVPEAQQEVL